MFNRQKTQSFFFIFVMSSLFSPNLKAQTLTRESDLVITEIHCNPIVKTDLVEFVEIYNASDETVDLTGYSLSGGINYVFASGRLLAAGGYLVVAQEPEQVINKWAHGASRLSADQILGPYSGKLSSIGERLRFYSPQRELLDEVDYGLGFPWPIVGDSIQGQDRSLQLINPNLDNDLGGHWRSALPTPGTANTQIFSHNGPPALRQVRHQPRKPISGEPVTITVKVTDPDQVAGVVLRYQIVQPGDYFHKGDSRFVHEWIELDMADDGGGADEQAGDHIYTAWLEGTLQKHRHLVRYTIQARDRTGQQIHVPYADDPQPNFAYFVYDGVPAWQGAKAPGQPIVEYSSEVLTQVPVYHLISKKADVERSTWREHYGGSDYKWWGTLIYDGVVYDHIRYRARGGVWRYAMGKNMWKFDFNRGHSFQARDNYGKKYQAQWDKLNLSACIQQGSFGQRGEQGMFEALSFRMFELADVPASKTHWLHFRIIDEAEEEGRLNAAHPPLTQTGTQYDSDFWGLYLAIEQMDGRFLDEHGLPDGNLFKMDNANREINNQGPTQPSDKSDLAHFQSGMNANDSISWWQDNVDLTRYYSYYAVYQAVHHGDITGKNWFLYHNPEMGGGVQNLGTVWTQLPWDVDLTWTTYYGSNNPSDPFRRAGVLNWPELNTANKNRLREFCDLLFETEQIHQLIDEYAAVICDPNGGPSIVDADQAMWDYHWVMSQGAYPEYLNRQAHHKAGQGRFYEEAQQNGYTRDFEGMVQVMKDYVRWRLGHMRQQYQDNNIPETPVITPLNPEIFPVNALLFSSTPFQDPQGADSFAAQAWRIAEVSPGSVFMPGETDETPAGETLIPAGGSWSYLRGFAEPTVTGTWQTEPISTLTWETGTLPIGYGESFIETHLRDMRYGYSTVYLRRDFEVQDVEEISELVLDLKYDDGVIVWINGNLVTQNNVPASTMPFNGTANSALENTQFVPQVLSSVQSFLQEGTNTMAIHLLNASLTSSSDCFLDVRLTAQRIIDQEEPEDVTEVQRHAGVYEITPVWESGEISDPVPRTRIPARGLKVGHTYRVRSRMKDNTGRWSHWSDPIQFVTSEPVPQTMITDLRVSELMVNPSPDPNHGNLSAQEYEFIELTNIGDEVLDLSNLSFTDGIRFDFKNGLVKTLAPGEHVVVIKNEVAYQARYGIENINRIAGIYEGKLANEGEWICLEDNFNGVIMRFRYDNDDDWPALAQGAGHSLVLVNPEQTADHNLDFSQPDHWQASTHPGGSPGEAEPIAW